MFLIRYSGVQLSVDVAEAAVALDDGIAVVHVEVSDVGDVALLSVQLVVAVIILNGSSGGTINGSIKIRRVHRGKPPPHHPPPSFFFLVKTTRKSSRRCVLMYTLELLDTHPYYQITSGTRMISEKTP